MRELKDVILQKLKENGASEQTLSLCTKILEWYEEGGSDYASEKIREHIKEYGEVKEEVKALKKILPKRKSKKKRKEKK
jgi:hypothetical protein